MATRLKRLELHGFKSFATPTSFVFDTGITAIIGPNGSGKSNISDALRWVLGEQSYTNLRGRRTEDIIFAGSSARAPLGMAEVTATLDNEDGGLPVAFSEVSVTRRAYRSGENQYLINGARVRLKDVLQVTASLGQSHTVIGQGLVDAVLSQRVDERRGLFEHAAGITGLRIKHASAARNLEESQANCTRLEDLMADLEPRLRSLERAAKQAREYDNVKRQLRQSLERYYARLWLQAADRLRESTDAVDSLTAEFNSAATYRDQRREALTKEAQAKERHAASLEMLRTDIQQIRDQHQRVTHDLALIDERQIASQNRRGDAEKSLDALQRSLDDLSSEVDDANGALDELRLAAANREQQVHDLDAAYSESRRRLAELESQVQSAEQRKSSLERDTMLMETRVTLLRGQLEQLCAERARHESESTERAARTSEFDAQRARAIEASVAASQQLEALTTQLETLIGSIAERTCDREDVAKRHSEVERQIVAASTRFETLKRLEESGVGLYAGVRQVLEASRTNQLSSVLGTLASLLVVPAELEAAIEAALGSHLQDIVVERWVDAERAIEFLKRTRGGRATFHPLDTVHGRRGSSQPRMTPGIRGLASDLISMDDRVGPVVEGLLGRVLVADDLVAARSALQSLSPGWSVVTIGGEIVRSSGTVTGGSRIKETGALARERELRELPRARKQLEKQRQDLTSRLTALDDEIRGRDRQRVKLEQEIESVRSELRDASAARERAERHLHDLAREQVAEQERADRLDQQTASIEQELMEIDDARAESEAHADRVIAELDRLTSDLHQVRQSIDDQQLQHARAELSGIYERIRGKEEQRARLGDRKRSVEAQIVANRQRLTELDGVIRDLDEARESATSKRNQLSRQLDELLRRNDVTQSTHQSAVHAEQAARQELEKAEERCRELERRLDHLSLDTARRRDELDLTLERASRDLELDDAAAVLSAADAAEHDDLPKLEREIARLRERLRRIGVAGDDAIEQYEREAERHTFLCRQLDDVRSASDALRALMSELDRTMSLEFDRTFAEVARAFESTFTALFGGGKARLVRCDDERGSTGIDIVAQPPGKRLQNLGLLSGGERALTAVALLFSILKVNPSPFCLLDEVDAALDESNVVRVRDELQRLSEKTQFVVVTHNRSTIEGADTLYGITMGDDGISRVLSLRLPVETAS